MIKEKWEEVMEQVEEGDLVSIRTSANKIIVGRIAFLGYAGIILDDDTELMLDDISDMHRYNPFIEHNAPISPRSFTGEYNGSCQPSKGKYVKAFGATLCLHIRGLSGQGKVYTGPLDCYY